MRSIREALRLSQTVGMAGWWCLETVWLGAATLWRVGVLISRWKAITAQVQTCDRGHLVPMYGVWDCACGSRFEGWVFASCPICRESAGYVPCARCGLPVRNPLIT